MPDAAATTSPILSASRAALAALLPSVVEDPSRWTASDDLAERWAALMNRPLPKRIKYAKALGRLLGNAPTLWLAIEYKDESALDDEAKSVLRTPIDADGWRALSAAHRLAACATQTDVVRAPTREEIHQNIQQSAKQGGKQQASSVPHALRDAYRGLAACVADEAAREAMRAEEEDLPARWGQMLRGRADFQSQCASRSPPPPEAWTALPSASRAAVVSALQEGGGGGDAWSHVDQLNTYANISANVPHNMMGKIESMASKLASDLSTGCVSMESLNLQSIGEEVLSQCDAEDLSALTNNLGSLLPTLQQQMANVPRTA